MEAISAFAKEIRKTVLKLVYHARASHIGGALSMADILAVLYSEVLNIAPENPQWNERDIFLLSKGHACTGLYAALLHKGFFTEESLFTYSKNDSLFLAHASHKVPGVELSTGSLGHALSVGCGLAKSFKAKGNKRKVFTLVSDGELDEGSNWEAILFAPHHKLTNLFLIVDFNKIQSFGSVNEVLSLDPLSDKFRSFGWEVREIDGHNISEISSAFQKPAGEKPVCVLAHTIKGKGIDFMESKLLWHYKSPSAEEFEAAMKILEA